MGRASGRTLELLSPSGAREVPIEAVQSLWVRGRRTASGAKWGAICLGFFGAVVVPVFSTGYCAAWGSDCSNSSQVVGFVAVGAVGGGAIGALIGAGIGAASTEWHQRFP